MSLHEEQFSDDFETGSEESSSPQEMCREMALFILVASLNAGGRSDQAQVLKHAEYQLNSLEDHGNNCWPLPQNKIKKADNVRE